MAISGFAVIGSRSCGPAATPISEIFATNNSENDRAGFYPEGRRYLRARDIVRPHGCQDPLNQLYP